MVLRGLWTTLWLRVASNAAARDERVGLMAICPNTGACVCPDCSINGSATTFRQGVAAHQGMPLWEPKPRPCDVNEPHAKERLAFSMQLKGGHRHSSRVATG